MRQTVLMALLAMLAPIQRQPALTLPHDDAVVVVLGTGTPRPDADRSGPALAVMVNGTAYLVDFGPGVVRRATLAASERHIAALEAKNLKIAFITHLHSDHTAGLSDLFLTPAVMGRGAPLELYGPPGLADMAHHIEQAYAADITVRTEGLEHGDPKAYKINVHEIRPGVVYQDANVRVTAFSVPHGSWRYAYGYRFDTAGRSIVISGDTGPNDAVAQACHGCDLLLHEAYSMKWFQESKPDWQKYLSSFHVSTAQLAAIATAAKPKQLVLYHQMFTPGDDPDAIMLDEIKKAGYQGAVASAHDLSVF
jgi:ribonuclease BN (tRNA processing enzyme)